MHYTVYKTTNLINGKQYVGSHVTDDVCDEYLGSGKLIRRAIAKHGRENFRKEILFEASSSKEMFAVEALIVNEAFVKSNLTYNLKVGGDGGWDFINGRAINNTGERPSFSEMAKIRELKYTDDDDFQKRRSEWCRSGGVRAYEAKLGIYAANEEQRKSWTNAAHEAAQSVESRAKRIESFARIGHSKGQKNSQFGTCWIKNDLTGETKKVTKEEVADWLAIGWIKGRLYQKRRG